MTASRTRALSSLYQLATEHAPVSAAEERELTRRVAAGDQAARQTMALCNLRLVMNVAGRYSSSGAEYEDLVHEGITGLLQAVDRFDPSRGLRFSTYALWWIRQAISRFVKGPTRTVRIPEHVLNRISKLRKARESGIEEPAELASVLGCSETEVENLLQLDHDPVSLDALLGREDGGRFLDLLEHPGPGPEQVAMGRESTRELIDGMAELDERQRQILQMRYLAGDPRRIPLRKLAPRLGVSAERVRQLERRALSALQDDLDPTSREAA